MVIYRRRLPVQTVSNAAPDIKRQCDRARVPENGNQTLPFKPHAQPAAARTVVWLGVVAAVEHLGLPEYVWFFMPGKQVVHNSATKRKAYRSSVHLYCLYP